MSLGAAQYENKREGSFVTAPIEEAANKKTIDLINNSFGPQVLINGKRLVHPLISPGLSRAVKAARGEISNKNKPSMIVLSLPETSVAESTTMR